MHDTSGSPAAPVAPLTDLAELVRAPISANSDGAPFLVGSHCKSCGATHFPRRLICFECRSTELQEQLLSRRAIVYSWTTVRVSSSRPTPYTVGYVDLPEGVRVFTTLLDHQDQLDFDHPVQLRTGPDGEWAFAPLSDTAAGDEA
jgi:uncharacterized OB-fold protein